jgi:hypothetical protein
MPLPALHSESDTRSITERANAIIKQVYNAIIPVGAANTSLISDGTTMAWQADSRVLQVVSTQTGAVATGTGVIPSDDTIPDQSASEGDQYMSLAITPKSASSRLKIEVTWIGANNQASGVITVALFQDSTAAALAVAGVHFTGAGLMYDIPFTHVMTSGTTSATTFKVRAGGGGAGITTFNGAGSARRYGGAMASSIVITEVLP